MIQGLETIILLFFANIMMTIAWYAHLKLGQFEWFQRWPLILVIVFSWGIAFFEYCLQVPANRLGFDGNGGPFSLMQLKIIQEAISLTVFTTMAITMFRTETLQWNHVVAFVLIIGAVFFAFLKK